jgi:hypothetical protein
MDIYERNINSSANRTETSNKRGRNLIDDDINVIQSPETRRTFEIKNPNSHEFLIIHNRNNLHRIEIHLYMIERVNYLPVAKYCAP